MRFLPTRVLLFLRHSFVTQGLIVLVGVLAYSNTFQVPFLFDDRHAIADNAALRNLQTLLIPSGSRWFGYLTFGLNYALGGLNPAGYHLVNLLIHVAAALLLFKLVVLTFNLPFFRRFGHGTDVQDSVRAVAFLAALLFVSHPVQTQAVTYIVQRFASLATMLFILSVFLYAKARIEMPAGRRWIIWYAFALLSALFSMKTKEISFTLPFVILLYEFCFFPKEERKKTSARTALMIFLLTALVIPISIVGASGSGGELSGAFRATSEISRMDYLATQFRVVITYIRLLFLPLGQMIDYDYTLYHSFLDLQVMLSFAGLAFLLGFGCVLLLRSDRTDSSPFLRPIAFGIFWFFITLSVESSVIPIADVIFEHRLYLPSVGAFIAIAGGVGIALHKLLNSHPAVWKASLAAVLAVLIVLPVQTYARNSVWRSEIDLWEDVLAKKPTHARAQAIIGLKFLEQGGVDESIRRFRKAVELKPSYAEAHVALGNAYMTKGWLDEGYAEYMTALKMGTLDHYDTAQLTMNIGTYYLRKGQPEQALRSYRMALGMIPDDAMIHHNLALAYEMMGMKQKAEEYHRKAHLLNPERY